MDPNQVKQAINSKFDSLFTSSDLNGIMVMKPNVCGVCDEFIKLSDICILSFKELKECYSLLGKIEGNFYHEGCRDYYFRTGELFDNTVPWERMFLSPGTQIRSLQNNHEEHGILTCKNCKDALRKRVLPKMAISNGFIFGSPPDCLLCLTEVERAFLTPVKTYGFCFSYTGGFQKELRGSLSYYKVKMSSIARTAAHFVTLGMTDNIVVLLYGRMTTEQKRKALNKNKMRTGHLVTAIRWLCTYNSEWKSQNIDIVAIASRLTNPLLIDNSTEIPGATNSNIENTESIQIFFPDSAIDICTGGQDTVKDFKLLMQEAKGHGYDFELQADLLRESVTDYKDNNLVNACLVQFPYGTGGLNEERYLSENKIGYMDIESYALHLSRISRPHFHEELFVLILYNMKMKMKMVRGATWRVRNMATASLLATELTEEDIDIAVRNRRAGMSSSGTGEQFLKAIDAIGRGVAHTNEAAKKARRTAECLQHNFGMPTHFLTVTPDDDNSILVQSYSQIDIDINLPAVDDMDAAEIENLAQKRKELRIKVPGIAAMIFEDILDIIIEVVIGWDRKSCTGRMGLFGTPIAFTCTIEEQGRKTLHTHIQIWTKEVYEERSKLFSFDRQASRNANQTLCKDAERTMRTSFFFNGQTRRHYAASFPHECTVPLVRHRKHPVPVPDQTLRELRYKQGSPITGKMFATCPHCPKSWEYEALVKDYILYNVKDRGFVACEGEGDLMLRMKAKALEYQKRQDQRNIPSYIIEAGYNLHTHTNSCFKTTSTSHNGTSLEAKKVARKRMLQCECRYRLPVRKKRKTVIVDACDDAVKWYDWRGKHVERHIKELHLKRGPFDLFQNQSCPAIGESKLSCNTNISMVFHGSTGQYAFKYCTKSTQQDDRAEFDRVMEQKDKILSKIPHANGERSEATRRLLLASFAHQRSNVIGAPLSSYLTRNEERFIFSHPTVWIPMKDLKSLINENHVSSSAIIYHGKTPFFLCAALHYLTRPTELEDICAFDFYSNYEVIRVTRKTVDSLYHFKNTEFFTHPSYKQSCDCFLQGVRKRHQTHLPKVFQFDFPDTASFGSDIMETNQITDEMEAYAEMICVLFLPFRSKGDLLLDGSHVLKLRESVVMLTETKQNFLNNIQDAKSNCFRIINLKDELQRVTIPANHDDKECFHNWRDDEQEEDIEEMQGAALDNFLEELNRDLEGNAIEPEANTIPTSIYLKKLKDKGRKECGYKGLCHLEIPTHLSDCNFLTSSIDGTEQESPNMQNVNNPCTAVKDTIFKCDIVKIIMQRTNRITRSFNDISGRSDDVEVLEANGSVQSIFDWARKAGLDQHQRRAFEIIIGHFLLTFVQEAVTSARDELQDRRVFNTQKSQLYKLLEKDRQSSPQTICLLHGPGGSGKTTVIDLTLEYAREYCSFFEAIEFNSRTIVVTALTGVAATIIRGETTHAAVYLNQTKELQPEQVEMWNNTRLLIVDEVSFASKEVFIELDKKLRKLKSRADCAYGGLNIIFSGDFRQLEPVGHSQQPIYKDPCPQFNDWVNCFIELQGMHRFKDDPEWGFLLRRFRDGLATIDDINIINSRVVTEADILPRNLRYATYFNRDRDAINAALFEQRCMDIQSLGLPLHDSILILSDNHFVQNGSRVYTTFHSPKKIWEECGEDDVKVTKCSHRMDPVLRLYSGCRVMLPHNEDVRNGIANGTQANVVRVNIFQGVIPFDVMINETCKVQAVFASQVESVELEHVNTRITPRIFHVTPKQHTFKVNIAKPHMFQTKQGQTEQLQMKATQIPILVNNATTGHKLQGCGVPIIFVHGWSNVRNWAYVILSRVRTLSGLYLREQLDTDLSNYAVPDELQNLLRKFRASLTPTMWTGEQYDALFRFPSDP